MKIVIATVQAPFITGGAEYHALNLKNALISAGHDADIITMPFTDSPPELIEDQIIMSRMVQIEETWAGKSDLCIGLKFPAYFFPHSNKVLWVLHQHRGAYEFFDTQFSNIKNDPSGRYLQRVIRNADNMYFKEAKRIYANSANVAARMKKFNGIDGTPLYHPCPDMAHFHSSDYDSYILMPSRINVTKRQLLALEALCHTRSSITLYILGKADNPGELKCLKDFILDKKLNNRVKFLDFVTQEEKLKLYAGARAVLFIPIDEDYGYITLEAMASSKAVITCTDSGGPLEFVLDGRSGLICKPDPLSIAEAIDSLAESPKMAKDYGTNANRKLNDMNITWDNVVKELTKV